MAREIIVITASGSGHLFPCLQLSSLITLHGYQATLLHPSDTSIPSHFLPNPLLRFIPISSPPIFGPGSRSGSALETAQIELEAHLSPGPLCAIVDFQMAWTKPSLSKLRIPLVSFFTFGSCAASMELAASKSRILDLHLSPGDSHALPGLPSEVSLSHSDLTRRPTRGPVFGNTPPWVPAVEGSVGLMFNTCLDLERPFLEYMSREMGMPVWAVGPLLPDKYWAAPSNSLIRDGSPSEEDLIEWLDSKPRGSVLYVSFGSELSPSAEECLELGRALEESTRPFIWADPLGNGPRLDPDKVWGRGRLMRGWAPQLLILSHPSTGGFLSHCGWNSTVEAIGLGVPILGWPIRGDQFLNAKLVVGLLKVGVMAYEGVVRKEDLLAGIEMLMGDPEFKTRAEEVKATVFGTGFPKTSQDAMVDFNKFIETRQA